MQSAKNEKDKVQGVGVSADALKVAPSTTNYKIFPVANERVTESDPLIFMTKGIWGANREMTSSLGHDLAKQLGVDAVAVVYIVIRKEKMNVYKV